MNPKKIRTQDITRLILTVAVIIFLVFAVNITISLGAIAVAKIFIDVILLTGRPFGPAGLVSGSIGCFAGVVVFGVLFHILCFVKNREEKSCQSFIFSGILSQE